MKTDLKINLHEKVQKTIIENKRELHQKLNDHITKTT